jgi:hypothetical protein
MDVVHPVQVFSQGCCTSGSSSLGALEHGALADNTLYLAANYQITSFTQAYEGSEKIDDPLRRTAEVAYFTLQAEYGLLPRMSFLASIYYSDKNRELTVESGQAGNTYTETAKFRGTGIGDLTLLGKFQAITQTIASPFGLGFGFGAVLPTGSYTEEVDGSQLSIDLQPGTGAVAVLAWAFSSHTFYEIATTLSVMGMYRYAGANLDGYRLGDEINTSMAAETGFTENFSAMLVVRSRYGMQDYADARFLNGTGGSFHDLMGGISYGDGPSRARVFAQIPLHRNVRGIQLTSTYLLGFEYGYTLDFRRAL